MRRLLEECPWQEGWVNHRVTLNAVPREVLLKAAAWSAEEQAEEQAEGGGPGPSELIM